MSAELFQELVAELAQSLQLPEMQPDSDGYLCLQFDDEWLVHIQYGAEDDRITLLTDVGDVDPDYETTVYRQLLEANLLGLGTGGAAFALEMGGRAVKLQQRLPASASFGEFEEALQQFVNTAQEWGERLENVPAGWATEAERDLERLPDDDEFAQPQDDGERDEDLGVVRV